MNEANVPYLAQTWAPVKMVKESAAVWGQIPGVFFEKSMDDLELLEETECNIQVMN